MGPIRKMRRCIVPFRTRDKIVASFMLSMIPVYYYFIFFVVSPDIYLLGSTSYWLNLITGHFIAFNVIGNYVCMIICDTSTRAYLGDRDQTQEVEILMEDSTRSCKLCDEDYNQPTHSWHCVSCDTCILKRDHHCMFIGYCIGEYNRRFFVIFLLYMFLGTTYYFYCTTIFMRKRMKLFIPELVAQLFCPPLIFFLHPNSAVNTVYLILYIVMIAASIMVTSLSIFNIYLITGGLIGIEAKMGRSDRLQRNSSSIDNVKEVLGQRWYLTWICPLITSNLPLENISSIRLS